MSTKLKAGTATSGAVLDADTTGILELQSGSTPTTAVTVDASQNVGIGTASPSRNLSVYGTNASITIQNSTTGSTSSDGLVLQQVGAESYIWNLENSIISFGTNNSERVRIDSSGNLGIGITTPTGRLDVKSTYASDTGTQTRFEDNTGCCLDFGGTASGAKWLNSRDTAAGTAVPMLFQTGGTERMRLDASGRIQINATTASVTGLTAAYLTINQANTASHSLNIDNLTTSYSAIGIRKYDTSGTSYPMYIVNSVGTNVGSISMTNSAVAFNTSSDYRLKENIEPMTGALATVAQLKPVTYDWKAGGSSQGFIAHELAEVCPEAVTGEKDAVDVEGNPRYQGIDTSFLVATLTSAIQEQQAMIEELKAEVAALKGVK